MKVTETKTKTTMYDTNGRKVSIVSKEILEIDTTPHLLNRKEGKNLRQKVSVYKNSLEEAKAIKKKLEKVKGYREGGRVFRDLADLIMIVEKPIVKMDFGSGNSQTVITEHPV